MFLMFYKHYFNKTLKYFCDLLANIFFKEISATMNEGESIIKHLSNFTIPYISRYVIP